MADKVYPISYVTKHLQELLKKAFDEYGDQLEKDASQSLYECAEDYAKELKPVTPRSKIDHEHLADTIGVKKETKVYYGKSSEVAVVYFRKYQLPHLLEFGWIGRNGKKVERKPFMRPLFDKNSDRYYRKIVEDLMKK